MRDDHKLTGHHGMLSHHRASRRRPRECGQIGILTLLVFATVGLSLVVGSGDIVVDEFEHMRADDAALLGAQSGSGQVDRAALYNDQVTLDSHAAVRACADQVATIAPEAQTAPPPCRVVGNEVVAQVVIDVRLPIPVPYINPRVSARRAAAPVTGTNTPQ
jgi:hypothetical protein